MSNIKRKRGNMTQVEVIKGNNLITENINTETLA